MPKIESEKGLSWKRRTTKKQLLIWLGWLIGVSIIVFAWQLISEKTVWFFVQDAPRQAADIGVRMVPPKWSYMSKLIKPVWDTINIATIILDTSNSALRDNNVVSVPAPAITGKAIGTIDAVSGWSS